MNPLQCKVVWNFAGFEHASAGTHKLYLACGTKWFKYNAWFAAENKTQVSFW